NPPWEKIKLQEKEFFAIRDRNISNASTKSARDVLIKNLKNSNPQAWTDYQTALHDVESLSKFLRNSNRFPLSARGDVHTYAIFAELSILLLAPNGRAGILVPIGISTDDTTKFFFGHLIENQSLVQLVGFENEEFIFPEVHHSFKFCALTMSGINVKNKSTDFVFFCRKYSDISQRLRHFELTHTDFVKINPNTLTCPIFRTHIDAELTKKIYYRNSVLVNEQFEKNEFYVSFFS